jgi:hypothetical protein
MSLIEDLRRQSADRKPGPRCGVKRFLDRLEPDERTEWAAVLADPDIKTSVIVEQVEKLYGRELSSHTVAYHRRGRCLCP